MKKIISLLSALGLGVTASSAVVSCNFINNTNSSFNSNLDEEDDTNLSKLITVTEWNVNQGGNAYNVVTYLSNYSDSDGNSGAGIWQWDNNKDYIIHILNSLNGTSFSEDLSRPDIVWSDVDGSSTTLNITPAENSIYTGSVQITIIA